MSEAQLEEERKMTLTIMIEVSEDNESTASPWWMIIDPRQQFKTNTENNTDPLHSIANMITGPFFSRKEAEDFLNATRYNFTKNAMVYCHSGCYTRQYDNAWNKAREEKRKKKDPPRSTIITEPSKPIKEKPTEERK